MESPQTAVPDREGARLAALRRLEVLDTPEEEAFDGIVRMAAKLCAAPMAAISLVDASRVWFKARTGVAAREVPRQRAFCNEAIEHAPQVPLIVRDAAADARFAGHPLVAGEPGVRFYAGMPLVTRGGETLGCLCVMDRSPRALDADQCEALAALAEQVIAELELRASRTRFAARYRNALLTSAPSSGDRQMAERLRETFEHLDESVVLTDADDRIVLANLRFRCDHADIPEQLRPGRSYEEFLRARVTAGDAVEAVHDTEAWIKARLERRRKSSGIEERRLANGRWIQIRDQRLPDGGILTTRLDITDRKRAEAESRERGRELQLIVDTVPVMITRLDRDERFVFVNRAYTELLELPAGEIIGRKVKDVIAPEAYAQVKPAIDRALSGDPVSAGRTQRRSNGEEIQIEGRYIPDVDVRGRVIGLIALHRDVTPERHARESLAKSEARFRSLTALTSDDWYWEQDADFRYVYISEDADARGAVGMKARAGKTRWELPWSGVTDGQWAAHRAQLEAHEVFRDFEIQRPGPGGTTVWVSVSGEPIFDSKGKFTGYRGITRNITEQRAAEQLLRLEHQVTRALSEAEDAESGVNAVLRVVCGTVNMGCGRFFKLDEAAGVLRFHDGWCLPEPAYQRFLENSRGLAFRPGEGLAGIIWQTGEPIWSSDTSRDPRVLGKSLAQNSDIRAAFAFAVRSEGKVIGVLSFSGQTAREPDARLLQAARIIGSQTGQFLQRKLAEGALAASEARFRAIFERSSAGMAISDAEGNYLTVNAAFARFFGYSSDEVVGKLKVADLRSPEDAEGASLYRSLVSGQIGFFERERPYRRKDGAQIWGHATVSAVRDAEGKAAYVVAVFSDITEKVLARARIERMNAELEERVETRTAELREALKELDAFTYSVSHDLRAPVGAVSGFAHLLRSAEAERLSDDGRRLLDFIEHNADRMTRLIEGLLRFSRLGRSDLRRARVSMNGLAGESLLDFVDEVARSRINAGPMPDCTGDPALLGQVWSNLIGNALKYSRNAEAPCIDIGWDAGRNAYFVRDNGVGFDMAYAGKLFGVFERLHHESEFEGSGIGLAIAERIVRLHGGAIWADAAPGKGATFWFKVPA